MLTLSLQLWNIHIPFGLAGTFEHVLKGNSEV